VHDTGFNTQQGARDTSFLKTPDRLGDHPATYVRASGVPLLEVKQMKCEAYISLPFSAKVKNDWCQVSLYAFHGMCRNSSTFIIWQHSTMYKFSTRKIGPETKQHIMKACMNCTWALVEGKLFGSYHGHVFPPRKSPCLMLDNGKAAKWMQVWCKKEDLCSGQKSVLVSTVDSLCINPLAYTDVPETAGLARSINP